MIDVMLLLKYAGSASLFLALLYAGWAAVRGVEDTLAPDVPREGDLIVVDPGEASLMRGAAYRLRARNSLGRDFERAHIPLSDSSVAPLHAELAWKMGAWRILRLDPHGRLAVNGSEVVDEMPVRSGDRLDVGRVSFRLESW